MSNFFKNFFTALAVVLSGGISFRLAGKTVTATLNGQPHHMTLQEALAAIAIVEAGQTGSVQIGDVALTIV